MNQNFVCFYVAGTVLTVVSGIVVFLLFRRRILRLPLKIMMVLLVAASSYLPVAHLLKYYSLHLYLDFAAWPEILKNIAQTGRPTSSIQHFISPQGTNWFAAHFTPLLYVLAVPFKLWPYSQTLIVCNFLLMASSIIPLYKLSMICRRDKRFSLFVVAMLLWYPTFQYIVLYEFDMLRFSIPVILWMLYYWEKHNNVMYLLFVVIAVLVREEVGLTVMMFGFYVLLFERRKLLGVTTILLGAVFFVVITEVVMPALSSSSDYHHIAAGSFKLAGSTPAEVIKNICAHPLAIMRLIFEPVKLANIFMFFLPLLFVSFLSPAVLISILANVGVGLLSTSVTYTSYMLYYLSPSIPFIFYAFIKAWPKLLKILRAQMNKLSRNQNADVNSAAMMGVLSSLLVANIFFGPSFLSLQFWFKNMRPAPFRSQNFHYSTYRVTGHYKIAWKFADFIPASAVVSAELFLSPLLYQKQGIMVFPQLESIDGKIKADYVFIDKNNPVKSGIAVVPGSWSGMRDNPQFYYDLIEKNPQSWELIRSQDGYFLYKRRL